MLQIPNFSREQSSIQVLIRTGLRVVILGAFASFGTLGFAKTLSGLLLLSAVYCTLIGAMRREPILGHILTNWDEAAIYLLVSWTMALLA